MVLYGGRSSVGRAPDCESGCRGFNPRRSPHYTMVVFVGLEPIPTRFVLLHLLMQRITLLRFNPRRSPHNIVSFLAETPLSHARSQKVITILRFTFYLYF